ncbi:MAG: glycosyltransferase [Anaerolineae bacterium]
MLRKRICIIAFKDARSTIHVLRQIHYLSPDYDLTVIAHGSPDATWTNVSWRPIPQATLLSKVTRLLCYVIAILWPPMSEVWYWQTRRFKAAFEAALASDCDAIHANDWQALPIAIEVARRTGAQVVFHQHEYAELEREDSLAWRLLVSPAIHRLLVKYTSDPAVAVDASITVCEPIAERYRHELGIHPIVVYNAPPPVAIGRSGQPADPHRIRLIHHGFAQRGRGLHNLVKAMALADERFTLDFMLMADDPAYLDYLQALARRVAPGRVFFRAPVRPLDIVPTVSEYDIGLCVIEPSTYNFLMMLPNKLFEYVQAGLALCIGPSPAMVAIARRHGVGVVTAGFAPGDIAAALNRLSLDEIRAMREASRQAAAVLNADVEMAKVVALYEGLFGNAGDTLTRPSHLAAESRVGSLRS